LKVEIIVEKIDHYDKFIWPVNSETRMKNVHIFRDTATPCLNLVVKIKMSCPGWDRLLHLK
jgi:hypothetical protein